MEEYIDIVYIRPENPAILMRIENKYDVFKELLDGGYVECVTLTQLGIVLWVDEDGKSKQLPTNEVATVVFGDFLNNDIIVGPCFITGLPDKDGEATSTPLNDFTQNGGT